MIFATLHDWPGGQTPGVDLLVMLKRVSRAVCDDSHGRQKPYVVVITTSPDPRCLVPVSDDDGGEGQVFVVE